MEHSYLRIATLGCFITHQEQRSHRDPDFYLQTGEFLSLNGAGEGRLKKKTFHFISWFLVQHHDYKGIIDSKGRKRKTLKPLESWIVKRMYKDRMQELIYIQCPLYWL